MKKILSLILALVLAAACCAALAEEEAGVPQPEGGKKFETNWAMFDMTVQIYYEEEGYRVYIRSTDPYELTGSEWEYSCYYVEDKDALVSVSSSKNDYTMDPDTLDITRGDYIYQDLDDEGQATEFTIDENGKLNWNDGRGDDGADLEFTDIGDFTGYWKSEDGKTSADITWSDSEIDEEYGYDVFFHDEGDESYADYTLHGLYDPEIEKLIVTGSVSINRLNADGEWEEEEIAANEEEPIEIIFSDLGDGKILVEKENGIELIYDPLGGSQG